MTSKFDNNKIFKRLEDSDREGTDGQEVDNYIVKNYQMWVSGEAHFQTSKDGTTNFKYPTDINYGLDYAKILQNDHTAEEPSTGPNTEKYYQKDENPTKITLTSKGLTGDFRGDQKAGPSFISNNFPTSGIEDADVSDLQFPEKSFASWGGEDSELMSEDELQQYQINGSGMGELSTYSTSDIPVHLNEFIEEQDMLTASETVRADHILAPKDLKWIDKVVEEVEEEGEEE